MIPGLRHLSTRWAFVLTVSSLAVEAQSPPTNGRSDGGLCWRGRPAPRCTWLLLSELGAEYPITSTETQVDVVGSPGYIAPAFEARLTASVGLLRTVGQHAAMGGVASAGLGSLGRAAAEARYRRWSGTSATSAELSAGYLTTRLQPANDRAQGITGAAGLTWADLVGAHLRVDVVQAQGRRYRSLAAGAHLGQRAGVAGALALGLYVIVFGAIYSGFE